LIQLTAACIAPALTNAWLSILYSYAMQGEAMDRALALGYLAWHEHRHPCHL
jgi:hypothetical protein